LNAAFPIAFPLLLAVLISGFRVALAILLLVLGMRLTPFALAVANDLCVLGVGLQLLAVVICPALALAIRRTANTLIGTILRSLKRLLAIAAATGRQAAISSGVSNRPLMETRSDLSEEI
jgi:hypothetical protein